MTTTPPPVAAVVVKEEEEEEEEEVVVEEVEEVVGVGVGVVCRSAVVTCVVFAEDLAADVEDDDDDDDDDKEEEEKEGDEEDEEDEDLDLNLGGSDDDDDNSGGMALGAMLTRSGTAGGGGGDNSWVAVRYGEIGARFLNMGTVAPGPDPEVNLGPPTPHSMSTVNASIRHLSAFAPQNEWFESGDDWKCLAEDGDEAMRQFTE